MNRLKYVLTALAVVALLGSVLFGRNEVFANCAGAETTIIDCGDGDAADGIGDILRLVLSVLTFGAGALGVVGVTIVGIMYMTARDNTEQTAKAKKRLLEIAVAMIFLAGAGAITNWLVPGGILINSSTSGSPSGGSTPNAQPSGGNGSGNGGGSGSPTNPANPSNPEGSENLGNREAGSESMEGATGGVGNGSEGWVEQGGN